MRNLFFRRNKMGLETIRTIRSKMNPSKRPDIRNDSTAIPNGNNSLMFTWGLVRSGLDKGYRVLNHPSRVALTSDKGKFRRKLFNNSLTMFTTTDKYDTRSYIENRDDTLILRPRNHFGGNDLVVLDGRLSVEERLALLNEHWKDGSYASLYIKKDKEFRVFVVQDKVAFVVEKIVEDKDTVAWNVAAGGRFENVRFSKWNMNVVGYAIGAMKLSGLSYGAVDVIVKDNRPYVLEINTSPHLTADYWSTCVAKCFDHIIETDNPEPYLYFGSLRNLSNNHNWKHFVHPAISDKAILNNYFMRFDDRETSEELSDDEWDDDNGFVSDDDVHEEMIDWDEYEDDDGYEEVANV